MIELALDGKVVAVPRDVVQAIASAAAGRAGLSGRHRDLSLQLSHALETGHASLGQADVRALVAVLEETHPDRLGPGADELLSAVA